MKAVALVDWNWTGHHPSYFRMFSEALIRCGWRVIALCPEPSQARSESLRSGREESNELLIDYTELRVPRKRFVSYRPKSLFRKVSEKDWAIRHFKQIERLVNGRAQELGWSVSGLVYPCIYDFDFAEMAFAERWLHLPWVGLYVHANGFRKAAPHGLHDAFRGSLCRGLGVLDEGIAEQVERSLLKPVQVFPDVSDSTIGISPGALALSDRLKTFANERPIVGLFGHLVGSKGVLQLIRVSGMPEFRHICFAFAGELDYWHFTRMELDLIREAFTAQSNIWAMPIRIPDEAQLNLLLNACDIVSVAYQDFPHSSNMLTKAACFRKPVITCDGYLLAERVRRFNLGEIIPQGDDTAMANAIARIISEPEKWEEGGRALYSEYSEAHSMNRWYEAVNAISAKLAGQ